MASVSNGERIDRSGLYLDLAKFSDGALKELISKVSSLLEHKFEDLSQEGKELKSFISFLQVESSKRSEKKVSEVFKNNNKISLRKRLMEIYGRCSSKKIQSNCYGNIRYEKRNGKMVAILSV